MSEAIVTKNTAGKVNGWLLPVWHVDDGIKVDQVYVTAIAPGARKGPHLHLKRRGLFTCIRGDVRIVYRVSAVYVEEFSGDSAGHRQVLVPPGCACALYNAGDTEALVLNLPSPPWRADDQDEHEVKDWTYEP